MGKRKNRIGLKRCVEMCSGGQKKKQPKRSPAVVINYRSGAPRPPMPTTAQHLCLRVTCCKSLLALAPAAWRKPAATTRCEKAGGQKSPFQWCGSSACPEVGGRRGFGSQLLRSGGGPLWWFHAFPRDEGGRGGANLSDVGEWWLRAELKADSGTAVAISAYSCRKDVGCQMARSAHHL